MPLRDLSLAYPLPAPCGGLVGAFRPLSEDRSLAVRLRTPASESQRLSGGI